MSHSIPQGTTYFDADPDPRVGFAVKIALAVWLAAVVALAAAGAFVVAPGIPPLPVFGGAVLPLVLFAIALRISPAFRAFVLALDVRLITAVQAWRYGGFAFIALYADHVLPGLFAWAAGLGDMVIGVSAPLWVLALTKKPEALGSKGFRLWNVLGLIDFVVAFSTATLATLLITGDALPSMAPMARLPHVLIPVFMVPLFAMLHISSLLQSRQARSKQGRAASR